MVAAEMKEVVDLVMGGEETLCLAGWFEPLHLSLSPSGRLVRILGWVSQALVPSVLDTGHQRLLCRAVTGQFIGDHRDHYPPGSA
jgi:hypothetical protein